jgi:hypothetical protein
MPTARLSAQVGRRDMGRAGTKRFGPPKMGKSRNTNQPPPTLIDLTPTLPPATPQPPPARRTSRRHRCLPAPRSQCRPSRALTPRAAPVQAARCCRHSTDVPQPPQHPCPCHCPPQHHPHPMPRREVSDLEDNKDLTGSSTSRGLETVRDVGGGRPAVQRTITSS